MRIETLLTGIKPTGIPHLGNYLGVIRPSLKLAESSEYQAFFFIADYHALNAIKDPEVMRFNVENVAATWLACGMDPESIIFYRQSRIPEIAELNIILSNVTAKGLMNQGHAYKAILQDNEDHLRDPDKGVNMGLYNYPILMSADILMFQTDWVPVGKDQIQHVEITRDIAESFNRIYGEYFHYPEAMINEQVKLIPGIDGKKMSKSYGNVIPIFAEEKQLRKVVMKIVTNSQGVEEMKNPDDCQIFSLYCFFANSDEQALLRKKYLSGGMGWGEAKQILYEKLLSFFQPMKDRYDELIKNHSLINQVLERGEEQAREVASCHLKEIKKIIGVL